MNIRDHQLENGIFARSWETGSEQWCVLLHDALGCVELWRDFPEKLAKHGGMNVFAYDRPGYGQSRDARNPRGFDYHDFEGRVRLPKVLQSAGIGRASVVGHSDGASMALCYAAAHPDRVSSLVVYGAHMDVDTVTTQGLKNMKGDVENAREKIQKLERYHGKRAQLLYQQWLEIWLDEEFVETFNLAPILPRIESPCFIFQGETDEYADHDHPFRIKRAVGGNAQAVIVRQMGHFPHIEHPEMALGLVLAHLPLHKEGAHADK